MDGTPDGSASRTFQSLFDAEPLGGGDARADQAPREDDDEVWDDDFPSDVAMESAEEDDGGGRGQSRSRQLDRAPLAQTISLESRHSIEEWADNEDDEDNWKEALQARVDQLELVVDKRSDLLERSSAGYAASPSGPVNGFAVPLDQRATLTLLPKTNLTRSISAPPAADEYKPASKLKAPSVVCSTTTSAGAKHGGNDANMNPPGVVTGDQIPPRKRSNSRDFLTRQTLATEHKRLAKATTPPAASNSIFVRAVVARGNSAGRNLDSRIGDIGHVDKRAKADEDASTSAISDAEAVRRHILNDIKKISVERIIADARRLHFLEDFYRGHPESSELKRSASTGATGDGARLSFPKNNNAI